MKDRAEKLLSEKLENATDGEVYLDNEDMQVIIDAAQNREAVTTNTSSEVGKILILKSNRGRNLIF